MSVGIALEEPGRQALRWQIAVMVATVAAVIALSLANGESPVLSGQLPDSDDYMRLVQVFGWLDSGDWWGRVLHRLNPPEGTLINWARPADLPYAVIVSALSPFLSRTSAAIAAAAIVPPLLQLPLFLWAMSWASRPLLGWRLALLCGPLALLSDYVFFQFIPGRADHHSWHVMVSTLLLGSVIRFALKPDDRAARLVAAFATAFGLWLGGEALPWVAAFNLGLAVIWLFNGRAILASALQVSLASLAACLVILPLAQPPGLRFSVACDDFSLVYASLPAFMLVFWGAARLAAPYSATPWHRLGLAIVGACLLAIGFFAAFPACRGGPYGEIDPRLADVWLQHTGEMLSVKALFGGVGRGAVAIIGPLLAALAVVIGSLRQRGQQRLVWLAMSCFLLPALVIACLHVQVLPHAAALSTIPLVWAIEQASRHRRGARWPISLPTFIAVIYCAIAVLPPRLMDIASGSTSEAGTAPGCDLKQAAAFLSGPAGLGAKVRLIAAPIDEGAELLFRTPHELLAGPFERDASGNLDLFDLLTARSDEAAHAIVLRRHIDIVMFCRPEAVMWLPEDPASFIRRLEKGDRPLWLTPLEAPAASGYRIFSVGG
jgi:hypothetical protein